MFKGRESTDSFGEYSPLISLKCAVFVPWQSRELYPYTPLDPGRKATWKGN